MRNWFQKFICFSALACVAINSKEILSNIILYPIMTFSWIMIHLFKCH